MSDVDVKIEGAEALLSLEKQINFAAARALTEAAKQSQDASVKAIQATFTTRGRWFLPSNKFGVRVKAARKDSLESSVSSAADWLIPHELGRDKTNPGGLVAQAVIGGARPAIAAKLPRRLKPRALGDKAFVIQTSKGPILFYRKGRGRNKQLVALYYLDKRVRIRHRSVIVEPTEKVVSRRFASLYDKALREALASAKLSTGGTP